MSRGRLTPLKPCADCGGPKPRGRGRMWCDVCVIVHQDEELTRVRNAKKTRKRVLRYLYGIEFEEYDELLMIQEYACAICKRPVTETQIDRRNMPVDHDHKTGSVRGLLCIPCNIKLGFLENETWNALAQRYLDRPPAADRERGSIIIEYALVASLVGAGAIIALQGIGLHVVDILNAVAGEL